MYASQFRDIFIERISLLQENVTAFTSDEDFSRTYPSFHNSPEALCKHLIGNLQHFIGATLAHSGYQRHRDTEFITTGMSRETIYDALSDLQDMITHSFQSIDDETLADDYPIPYQHKIINTHQLLLTLLSHFDYHLGQVNAIRRLA